MGQVVAGVILFVTGGTLVKLYGMWRRAQTDDVNWIFDRLRMGSTEAEKVMKEVRSELELVRQQNVRTLLENVELRIQNVESRRRVEELQRRLADAEARKDDTR